MRFRYAILLLIAILMVTSCSRKPQYKRFTYWDFEQMHEARKSLKRSLYLFNTPYNALIDSADQAMGEGPFSVTNRSVLSEGANAHDYLSFGAHWWPDPSTSNGLPYVRHEPEVNPDAGINTRSLQQMSQHVQELSMAWFFSREKQYVDKAGEIVRSWFLDSLTRMNPNLDHAGSIPGRTPGRGSAVTEGIALVTMLDGIVVAETSGGLRGSEERHIREWYQSMFQWLLDSPMAVEAGTLTGRHALGRELQLLAIAHLVKDDEFVQQRFPSVTLPLIRKMVGEEGRISADLRGNGSFAERVECLEYLFKIGEIGRRTETDVDGYMQSDGGLIRRVLVQMILEYQELQTSDAENTDNDKAFGKLGVLIHFAAWQFKEPSYGELWDNTFSKKYGHLPDLLVLPGHENL